MKKTRKQRAQELAVSVKTLWGWETERGDAEKSHDGKALRPDAGWSIATIRSSSFAATKGCCFISFRAIRRAAFLSDAIIRKSVVVSATRRTVTLNSLFSGFVVASRLRGFGFDGPGGTTGGCSNNS